MNNPMGTLRSCPHCGKKHYSNSNAGKKCGEKTFQKNTTGSMDSARTDFLSQEETTQRRPLEEVSEDINDLVQDVDVDIWSYGSNIVGVFNGQDDYSLVDYNDQMVDYHVDILVQDNGTGEYYTTLVRNSYGSRRPSYVYPVEPVPVEVKTVEADMEYRSYTLDDPELAASFMDFASMINDKEKDEYGEEIIYDDAVDVYSLSLSDFNDENTGVRFYEMEGSQTTRVTDKPEEYDTGVVLGHNGEGQNARLYATGHVFMDERLGRGFIIMGENSSEDYTRSDDVIVIGADSLSVNPGRDIEDEPEDDVFTGRNKIIPVTLTGDKKEKTWYRFKTE